MLCDKVALGLLNQRLEHLRCEKSQEAGAVKWKRWRWNTGRCWRSQWYHWRAVKNFIQCCVFQVNECWLFHSCLALRLVYAYRSLYNAFLIHPFKQTNTSRFSNYTVTLWGWWVFDARRCCVRKVQRKNKGSKLMFFFRIIAEVVKKISTLKKSCHHITHHSNNNETVHLNLW